MRKIAKMLGGFLFGMVLVLGVSTECYGATATTDMNGVIVTVTTDAESYESGDTIELSVTINNTTQEDAENVHIYVETPKGVSFEDNSGWMLWTDAVEAGDNETVIFLGKAENSFPLFAVIGTGVLLLCVAFLLILKKKGKKTVTAAMVTAVLLVGMVPSFTASGATADLTLPILVDGEETSLGVRVNFSQYYMDRITRTSVHDPSVVYDPQTETYYIFGSHNAWAKSTDLVNWTSFKNNINTDYRTIFADVIPWSEKGGSGYNVSGNMWAPDVIYNEELGKWTMYMSINGDNWYSSIVLLTADSLEGDWTYVGPVVYSGFTNKEEALETDFYDVYNGTDFPERYNEKLGGSHSYGLNAIDPCVFYDEEGRLWMAYGSWFGGIYLLELDPQTGLRLESHTYETVENVSDEYQGIKIAGGLVVSGEGAYIEYIDGYYYLYLSYGGLSQNGGYNMRLFRSENPEGPYTDLSGDSAIAKSGNNNINGTVGVRVMGNYRWDFTMSGQVAQGHNSVIAAENGIFLVYHTRFSNQGEVHSVRVHQQFVNEAGWLVTAPFEYNDETLNPIDKPFVVGDYKVIEHKLKVNYGGVKCNETVDVKFHEDGTVTGAFEGTWAFSEELGSPYVTLTLDNETYYGVFLIQKIEGKSQVTTTFTVLGDNEISIWGYQPVEK